MAGFSLAEALLSHVYRLHLELERECEQHQVSQTTSPLEQASGSSTSNGLSDAQRQRINSTVSEICIAITILQGLTLCSRPSKRITQRKSSLELLLQIVLSDYCTQLLPPILVPATLTPQVRTSRPLRPQMRLSRYPQASPSICSCASSSTVLSRKNAFPTWVAFTRSFNYRTNVRTQSQPPPVHLSACQRQMQQRWQREAVTL